MADKNRFADSARQGNILAIRCKNCSHMDLSTVYFCKKCGRREFEECQVSGRGSVATYTIITVPPDGFEKHVPYAWVVLSLDGSGLRVSGFMAGIAKPDDLPVGTRAHVVGFDERGIILARS